MSLTINLEGKCSELYFNQILLQIPKNIRPGKRRAFKAYDGVNNIFNLGYEILSWKVHRALLNAKLDPFLGYLHSTQYS
ncbi:MAG: CRISPR-associated endonuclease Cas1, partial [Candidatus Bathyarchaeota archaeon]